MTDCAKDWVLPNGFTYIASTAGHYGSWAKALDPLTAARKQRTTTVARTRISSPSGTVLTKPAT